MANNRNTADVGKNIGFKNRVSILANIVFIVSQQYEVGGFQRSFVWSCAFLFYQYLWFVADLETEKYFKI